MSIECDVTVYCDGCHSSIYDDHVYCVGCAGDLDTHELDTAAHEKAVELVKDWFDDNELILTAEQWAFGEAMHESIRRGTYPRLP